MTVKVRCPRCGRVKLEYRAGIPAGAVVSEVCEICHEEAPDAE